MFISQGIFPLFIFYLKFFIHSRNQSIFPLLLLLLLLLPSHPTPHQLPRKDKAFHGEINKAWHSIGLQKDSSGIRHQGQILVPLRGAPQADQVTQLSPACRGLRLVPCSSLAVSPESMRFHELRSAVSLGFPIVILVPLADLVPPTSL